jgi:hypothetical protein
MPFLLIFNAAQRKITTSKATVILTPVAFKDKSGCKVDIQVEPDSASAPRSDL